VILLLPASWCDFLVRVEQETQNRLNPLALLNLVAFVQDGAPQKTLRCRRRINLMQISKIVVSLVVVALVGFSAGARARNTDISDLAWMAGNWSGVQGGVEMEELWQHPKGNTMLGLHRDVAGGRTVSFEFLRIEATPEAITYWASPRGRPATPFRLIEQKGKRVVFENLKHDFPQRVIYWLGDDGALHAKIEGTMKGKLASEEWTWRRSEN
jgi:Domain of unknown function (DUF6265)